MLSSSAERYRDAGLLVLRIGIGLSMALGHGLGKLTGGPEGWAVLGETMGLFGIEALYPFWGFMSAFAEFFCALLVVVGLFFRPALVLLVINMSVATAMHIITGNGSPLHAIDLGIVFIALLITGAGRYSLDAAFGGRRRSRRY